MVSAKGQSRLDVGFEPIAFKTDQQRSQSEKVQEIRAEGELFDADLKKKLTSSHVPYFRDTDPSMVGVKTAVNKPNDIVSLLFLLVWLSVSPVWSVRGWLLTNTMLCACLSAVFIEFNSGLFHIVFDNEKLNHIPVLGTLTRDFQIHHLQPAKLTQVSASAHLRTVHLPGVGVFGWQVLCTSQYDGLRPFWFFSILWLQLMYMTHRWAHSLPSKLHPVVQWGQKAGLLLSMGQHLQHHRTYDCNYSLFTGWSNVILNKAVVMLRADSLIYVPMFVVYSALPTLLCLASSGVLWL